MKTDIIKTENGKEFFKNQDGKLVSKEVDTTKEYRINELLPGVIELLNEARSRGRYPSENFINAVISFQSLSPEKAENYIKYKLLGKASYSDVFSKESERNYKEDKHREETKKLEEKIDDLQLQFQEMQKLLLNIAGALNKQEKSFCRVSYMDTKTQRTG